MTLFDFDASGFAPLPKLRGLFVTGTDTEVGKTLVAGAIARSLSKAGRNVEVFKPAASGCRKGREGLISDDAEFLAACAESRRPIAQITPQRFAHALAPNVAAEREGRTVDLEAIFSAYRSLEGACDTVIVEGVGGLLCPIREDFWVIHLAKLTGLPLVVVARPKLGTINHTLLTLHAARSMGIEVAGVIINRYPVEPEREKDRRKVPISDDDYAIQTNPRQIAMRGRTKILALVPDEPTNSVEKIRIGKDTQYVIDQVDWESVMDDV
ncbi:MAG: dethiobiotin synthase [Phycisphaerae bacterium]